eukprot:4645067-Amphidinium_carterae.1
MADARTPSTPNPNKRFATSKHGNTASAASRHQEAGMGGCALQHPSGLEAPVGNATYVRQGAWQWPSRMSETPRQHI